MDPARWSNLPCLSDGAAEVGRQERRLPDSRGLLASLLNALTALLHVLMVTIVHLSGPLSAEGMCGLPLHTCLDASCECPLDGATMLRVARNTVLYL